MVYCRGCGKEIHETALICPNCGAPQATPDDAPGGTTKRILPAFLLCFFLGWCSAHRFYVGKWGTAILQTITLGGLGIWLLIDFIMIIIGSFRDSHGAKITQWT